MTDADRLRVALIASSFAPHIGGVEEHVAQLARELAARGHRVEVWAVDRGARPEEPFGHGIEVRYLPTPLPARSLPDLWRFVLRAPRAWRLWSRARRGLRPDLLHVHCFGPNGLYALALHRRFGIPLIVTSHGETNGDDTSVFDRSALLRRGLRDALARAAVTTAPSEFVLSDLRARFGLVGGEIVVNGVDLDVIPEGEAPGGRYIVAVRRLGWMKGIDLLITAFSLAVTGGRIDPEVRLVIVGDGPERGRLEEQIRHLGLGGRVDLLGWRTPPEVATLVAAAEAMVVPSRSEAFGIVALEAWRAGTALVMTSRGGASEFMTDGSDAVLVDPEDAVALAAVLERVTADADLRETLSAAGRARVADFSWGGVVAQYERHYAKLTEPRAAS
ncbi:glycosyltransferase family 4 protein [Microbacterium sp. SD291]|uniref:glycosyltransferase family 4 protein n=1 Tax=Microbacterium sp. SD291 TaxID=2782007 RepID=UPI001A961231|nr:glycosyltransferase family 4 protein [Microbacterium sp. SD291]MBO0980970.1 glycosyltransferase family 4 protein [Microbacterium sp. SD291]